MKKLLSIIVAILIIVTTIPFAFAADVVASGNCGANGGNVKWTLDSDGTLTISGTGNMADYPKYSEVPWINYRSDVKKLIIEDGVTSIGENTGYVLTFTTSIYIGKDVKSISGRARDALDSARLETITVSEDNEYYKTVDNVLFSKDGKDLLYAASKGLSDTYTVPDGVVKINEQAFDFLPNLEKVVLSDSVEEIGDWNFYECKSLKILDVGMAKISSFGNEIFTWSEHPVEVIADKDNEYVSVVNGSLFSKIDGTLFYAYVTDNKCVVPYGVKIIPENTIYVEDGSVVVPDTVETIERHGINVFDSVVHYLGTESQFQEIYEGDMSDFDFEWQDISFHYCVQQSNIPASCTDDGVTEWYCSTCDETIKYVTGYAFGHDIVEVEAKAPTCTEIGWDAYEYCTACTYTTYVEKEALNHKDTLVQVEAKAPTCTEIGWDAYEYCTACDYTTYVEIPALGHADADNDGVCDHGCGAEVVTLGDNVYPVDGDITNTGIHIGAFAAFDNCYKAGDGYILIKGEGNDDTVMTLYNATIDVRGTGHKDAIEVDGEDIEIRFFGENNIFADEEAYTTAIGSNRHSQTFIGADDAVLNLYGNVAVSDINIESGTVNVYGADVNDIESVYVEGYLVISEGAVLNIISGDNGQGFNCGIIAQKEIVAEGEFNAIALTGVETDNEIIYNLTAIGNAVLGADTYNPSYGMEIPEDMNVEVNFIVPEGASVTVPEGITLNLDSMTNVDIDGELIVYGTLICTHTGGEDTCVAPAVCDICKQVYGEKLTHTDEDGDYICDHGCGHEFEKPAPEEPTPDTPDEPEDETCADCGKVHTNFFSEIICLFTRIINFIKNLFA